MLLLVPLVVLSTLWVLAASLTLSDGLDLKHVTTIHEHLGHPARALSDALQKERRLSVVYLAHKKASSQAVMAAQRRRTDREAKRFRTLAEDGDVQDVASAATKRWTDEILHRLDTLPTHRHGIDAGAVDRTRAYTIYTDTIATITGLRGSLSSLPDDDAAADARTLAALAQAREVLSEEDALLAGALATGHVTRAERADFTKLVGTQRFLYGHILPDLRPTDRQEYQKITSSPQFARLQTIEDRVVDGGARGVSATGWDAATNATLARLRDLERASVARSEERTEPIADGIILRITLAGALGLLAVIAALVLSLWVARSVMRDLTGLKRAALDLANERLPAVVRRLRRGEDVDVATEAPPLSFPTDEIDQVGQAFNAARRQAIQATVEEAEVRRSVSGVFINLARRSQRLLHRQLTLLDAMERRVEGPEELDDLFRLDHLATRMRRHAEGLIILSGHTPGRGWRRPVPVVDVVRAAAAEVEDYTRVRVATMPRVAIAGPAVADVIHLLAELIENATLFSLPRTAVEVTGQDVTHGFAIEITDQGLGMDPASLAAANERLADPPEFALSNSTQLGLFVVGRLARRHDVRVTLRASPYDGVVAVVLVPPETVVRLGGQEPEAGEADGYARAPALPAPSGSVTDAETPPTVGASGSASVPDVRSSSHDHGEAARPPLPRRHRKTPEGEASPAGSDDDTAAPSSAADDRPALPRRVRQANLAPELRGESSPLPSATDERSPEEMRTMLSSIQKGWLRGRSEVERPTGEGSPRGDGASARTPLPSEESSDQEER